MTFLTFSAADHLNGYAVNLMVLDIVVELFVDAVIPVVCKLYFGGTMAVDTPAHAQRSELADFIHLLDRAVTGLTLYFTGVGMLSVTEENVIGQVVDADPLNRLAIPRIGAGIRIPPGV